MPCREVYAVVAKGFVVGQDLVKIFYLPSKPSFGKPSGGLGISNDGIFILFFQPFIDVSAVV